MPLGLYHRADEDLRANELQRPWSSRRPLQLTHASQLEAPHPDKAQQSERPFGSTKPPPPKLSPSPRATNAPLSRPALKSLPWHLTPRKRAQGSWLQVKHHGSLSLAPGQGNIREVEKDHETGSHPFQRQWYSRRLPGLQSHLAVSSVRPFYKWPRILAGTRELWPWRQAPPISVLIRGLKPGYPHSKTNAS